VAVALWLTGTTLNLQSFMGAIMALGVATANAILLVSFAERVRKRGEPAAVAAVTAANDRLRPILMTSIAMTVGMLPLAIGFGEGGRQSAPLGRAVVGGLVASTVTTLLVLPAVFALVMGRKGRGGSSLHPFDADSSRYVPGGGVGRAAGMSAAAPASLAIMAIMASGCGGRGAAPATPPAARERSAPVVNVAVTTPARATLRRVVVQPAQIEAYEATDLHARLSGFVEQVLVDIGDDVKLGQPLVVLGLPELVAERAQKAAAVEQAVAEVRQAESLAKVAAAGREAAVAAVAEVEAAIARADATVARRTAELVRTEKLVADGAVTESLADEMRSLLAAARAERAEIAAQVRSAEAAVSQAGASIEKAAADLEATRARVAVAEADGERVGKLLEYGTISAPFAGIVTARYVHPGFLTTAGGAGETLISVARIDRLRGVVHVPEIDAAFVEPGDAVELRLQAIPGRAVKGAVARTAGRLADATRTLRVEVDLDPAAEGVPPGLRPGLYATASIVAEEHAEVLAVPRAAVLRTAGGPERCFVVEEGRARERTVRTGLEDAGLVEILDGVAADDRVVTAGAASLVDGQAVAVAE
jgi:HlyD family secretion protein